MNPENQRCVDESMDHGDQGDFWRGWLRMKGVLFLGDRECSVVDRPIPRPGHGEALVKVLAAGICGSDLHVYRSQSTSEQVRGHEASGVVVSLGPGVKRLKVGDRVAVHHHQGCGVCYQCSRGETVACTLEHTIVGVHVSGAFGEYLVAQERNCIPLPASASFVDGAFLACTGSTAYAALRRLGIRSNETLAVYGLGPVGLCCVLVGRALGLRVIGVDVLDERVDVARRCGAQAAINASKLDPVPEVRAFGRRGLLGGDGVDWVIETSGSTAGRSNVLPSLRREGGAAIVGVSSDEKVINPTHIHGRAARIIGSVVFPLSWMWDLAHVCEQSNLSFERAVTHRFTLSDAAAALATADVGRGGKVVFINEA